MDRTLRLRDCPYVVVRISCRDCPRIGRYRLAVLVERFGAEALMVDVLEAISAACPRNKEKHPGRRWPSIPAGPRRPAAAGRPGGVGCGLSSAEDLTQLLLRGDADRPEMEFDLVFEQRHVRHH